jgi:hypothetical protein
LFVVVLSRFFFFFMFTFMLLFFFGGGFWHCIVLRFFCGSLFYFLEGFLLPTFICVPLERGMPMVLVSWDGTYKRWIMQWIGRKKLKR